MAEFRIDRLAAIIPVHSHYDHAMDVGIVANRSSAVVLGSESTANIARGANLPVDQYQILANGETRKFDLFGGDPTCVRYCPPRPEGSLPLLEQPGERCLRYAVQE